MDRQQLVLRQLVVRNLDGKLLVGLFVEWLVVVGLELEWQLMVGFELGRKLLGR